VSFGAFLGRKLPLMIASFFGETGICPIIETVVFLGRQNIPLRSDRDDASRGHGPLALLLSATALSQWYAG